MNLSKPIAQADKSLELAELVENALLLLQLIQLDLKSNFNMTTWARAKRAKEVCEAIEKMFSPK